MNKVQVNFENVCGSIKPLHSVCCAPYTRGAGANQTQIHKYFTEGNIPYCRLHDCCGAYGGTYYVDVPNVFPNFDADENDPANYDFYYTDEYIAAIQESGCEAYYRLGTTIEWGSKKITSHPPKDFAKWARICEHIIRHYNEGWADGFRYNLQYWEIWNEPENPGNNMGVSCQWTGTKEEFFELYGIASKHLKACFPMIKIGGYGSCGFYAVTREKISAFYKEFVTWFKDFLAFTREHECPLDFYSWHIYTANVSEVIAHGKYVRETLDSFGYTHTEVHLNEWNINAEGTGFAAKHNMEGASFNAAVLCEMQNTSYIDMAHYYCFSSLGRYNGFMDQNDGSICPSWYPFVAFGKLYQMQQAVETLVEGDGIYALSAKDKQQSGILISNYNGQDADTIIQISGLGNDKIAHVCFIRENCYLKEEFRCNITSEAEMYITLPKQTVAFITFDS